MGYSYNPSIGTSGFLFLMLEWSSKSQTFLKLLII